MSDSPRTQAQQASWSLSQPGVAHAVQWRHEMWRVLALVLGLKCLLLILDPNLRLFVGDSESYLHAALSDWIAPDRSFTYPWLVRVSAVLAQSAFALVVLQTLFGAAIGMLAFGLLRSEAGVAPAWAIAVVVLITLEPAQLFYERILMAESAGLLAWMAMIVSAVRYAARGNPAWLLLMVPCGLLAVSMRMSMLPAVLGLTAIAPLLRLLCMLRSENPMRLRAAMVGTLGHLLLAVIATWGLHTAFKHDYGELTGSRPDYMRAQGQMRLGLVLPLVKPEHLERAGLSAELLETPGLPITDPRSRESHLWLESGLWSRIQKSVVEERVRQGIAADSDYSDYDQAQRLARKISARALQDDPFGLVRLGFATFRDYFVDAVALDRMHADLGKAPPSVGTLQSLATALRYDARDLYARPGIVFHAFAASRWWLTAVLFLSAPLGIALLAQAWPRSTSSRFKAVRLVIGITLIGMVASQFLFSHIVSFRYLHPMPPLFLTGLALLLSGGLPSLASMRKRRAHAASHSG